MNRTVPTITPDAAARTRAALDARAAWRLGIDPRDGKRVALRVVSRGFHAICGHAIKPGEQILDVHELDAPFFVREVETASAADLDRVRLEQEQRIRDNEEARRQHGNHARKVHDSWPAVFTAVMRRGPAPLDLVEVLDDAQPAATPKRKGAP